MKTLTMTDEELDSLLHLAAEGMLSLQAVVRKAVTCKDFEAARASVDRHTPIWTKLVDMRDS